MTMAGLVMLGFIVSLIAGLTSVGSGALMTPILYLDFSSVISHTIAVGTSTTQGSIVKFFGSLRNYIKRTIKTNYAFIMAATGVPLAIAGAFLTKIATSYSSFQLFLAAVFVIAAASIIIQVKLTGKKKDIGNDSPMDKKMRIKGMIIGAYVGLIAGMTGISTGSLAIASILIFMNLKPHTAVDVAIFEGFIILLAATITQICLGNVSFLVTLLLIIGGIPGILIGSSLKSKFNPRLLIYAVCAVILLESIRIILNYFLPNKFFIF